MDISKSIKFIDICEMLEKIQKSDEKDKQLGRYFESFRKFSQEFRRTNGDDSKTSFYCVLRCLIPGADTVRDSYGIKVTTLGKIYIKILQLPAGGDDAIKLQHRSSSGIRGDYADIVYSVLKTRTTDTPSDMSLFDIHAMLDAIATDDRRNTERMLTKLTETTSALEQKWFIRLLLKRMHLGIGEQKIFAIFHPKAKELYTRCTDLEKVCIAVDRGEEISLEETIVPFQHVRPMLCERLDTTKLYDMLGSDTVYAETKMDGERFQLHMADETFKYISRNGRDYTSFFGRHHAEGNLTPLVVGLLETHVKSIILDGEMMVWDKEAAIFRVKGENFNVKHLRTGGNLRPCFVAYDLLYLNGKSIVDVPYAERVEKLKTSLKEEPGILLINKRTKVCTLQHFMDIFNAALDANEEGVVVKLQRSTYKPGSRKGGWFKVKADYIEGLTSDMDVLIMGGYYNRTKTYIDSYLVGVIQGGQDNASLYCVGKVATGLSKDERIRLNGDLLAHWKKGYPSKALRFGTLSPDVWIEPRKSIIIQVKASELGQASSFATPFVLRFPRIEAVRSDKPWNECMTLEEYERFYKGDHGVKKINKRGLQLQDITSGKKAKVSPTKSKSLTTVYCSVFNRSEVQVESSVFDDFNFCVLSGLRGSYTVFKLKELVVKNGGNIVENPSPTDHKCICIAGDITFRVKELRDTGLYNVVSCNWLVDTAERKRLQLKPRDMICATAEMKEQLKTLFDSTGDSYTDHVDVDELKSLLHELDSNDLPLLQEHELTSFEEEIYGQNRSPNFFRNFRAFFYCGDGNELSHSATLAKLAFQWRGGVCVENEKNIKFVFADPNVVDLNALEVWFLATFTKRLLKVQVVSIEWITDSERESRRLSVDDYLIKFKCE